MGQAIGQARPPIAAAHLRTDAWWALPLTVVVVLGAFGAYSTWAAFQNAHYFAAPYLSPFYSPCLYRSCLHATFGGGLPDIYLPIIGLLSPAFLILIGPLSFRLTCYYYRKAYYRSFWLSPPACAVAEPHGKYTGETRFPLIFQNIHRYAWYFAVIFAGILTWDAVLGFDFDGRFGIGVGSLILLVNAVLILGYTLGCHSCRHITAGRINNFSKHPVRYKLWGFVSKLNAKHMQWAWASLIWIVVADGYIRLVANGTFHDFHHVF